MQVDGRVRVHARGFGFVEYDTQDGLRSAFIDPPSLNPFLHGDRVRARVMRSGKNRFQAHDIELTQRNRQTLFGSVVVRKGQTFVRPDRLISNTDWELDAGGQDLEPGELVVGRIHGDRLTLEGKVSAADASLERVRARYGIRNTFPPSVLEAATADPPPDDLPRRDLTHLPTITIDAPTSKDLDDALSVLPADPGGGIRVLVSIADVDAMVPEGSELDLEARRRGTSVYLAGGMTPMLPRELSEDRCSILPETERKALTAELRVDPEGNVTAVDVYASRIRSDRRLSYEEVARVFAADPGDPDRALPDPIVDVLAWLRAAASRIAATRAARGGVRILRQEAYVQIDDDSGEPTEFSERADNEAHALVERLMVAANEGVARWLYDRGWPGVYRIHPPPSAGQVQSLQRSAENLGLHPGFGPVLTPRALAAFEAQYAFSRSARAMDGILTKILGPARYQTEPDLHFGLGAPLYLHFTSPIRRYADLMVHRLVKRYLRGERSYAERDGLAPICDQLNDLARRAAKAETERLRMLAARHFGQRVGERFEGRVVSVKSFGLVVYLFGTGVTATVPNDSLPDGADYRGDGFVWNEGRLAVGDKVEVQVVGADEELGRIELSLEP